MLAALTVHAAPDSCGIADGLEDFFEAPVSLMQEHMIPVRLKHSAMHTTQQVGATGSALIASSMQQSAAQHDAMTHRETRLAPDKAEQDSCPARVFQSYLTGTVDKLKPDLTSEVIFPVLVIMSLVLLLVGHKVLMPSIFIILTSAVAYPTFEILLNTTGSCYMPLVVAGGAGLFCGILAIHFLKVAFFVSGALIGLIMSYQFKASVLLLAGKSSESNALQFYWAFAILIALVCGFLVYHLREDVFAIVTSLIGAYGLEIGFRASLAEFAQYEMSESMSLGFMIGAFALGLLVQMCSTHSK